MWCDCVVTRDPARCVMLADTMNGENLPDEHGGPLRVIVPGFIGARSVKWLHKLRISKTPSTNFYMTSDYKKLPEQVGPDGKADAMKKVGRAASGRTSSRYADIGPHATGTAATRDRTTEFNHECEQRKGWLSDSRLCP